MSDFQKLWIRTGVIQLFNNIGWGGLLNVDLPGYKRPTYEFATTVRVSGLTLYFQLMNTQCQLTFDQICGLIGAPVIGTHGAHTGAYTLQLNQFWKEITDSDRYDSSHAKASLIVHPVLRVAHRVISGSVYAREEASSVNSSELLILYWMTHPGTHLPNFGSFVCQRLSHYTNRTSGAIACGGIVTLLSTHPSVPSIPEDMERIKGSHLLTVARLRHMGFFDVLSNPRAYEWSLKDSSRPTNSRRPIEIITNENKHILRLPNDISNMDWRLLDHRRLVEPAPEHVGHVAHDDEPDNEPPEGVHPWVYQQLQDLRLEQTRQGGVLDNIWQWTQGPHYPPPQ